MNTRDDTEESITDADGAVNHGNDDGRTIPLPEDEEPTGYKRPPRKHQFKPGQSGNPRGRPKGAPGLRQILKAELDQKVRGTRNGKAVSLSKLQVIVNGLTNKAMNGDQRAIEQLITLNITMFGLGNEDRLDEAPLTAGELAFLNAVTNRLPPGDAAAGLKGDPDFLSEDDGETRDGD